MNVPLLDLKAQYAPIKAEVMAAVGALFDSQQFILGPAVTSFEAACAAYIGTPHALGISSGTDALLIALMALDIKPGDEVITSPYTFFATAGSIARLGAKPVFVDIEPGTLNINAAQIERAITRKTRALMPVHLFGQCADMETIGALASAHKLGIIEDAAQAIGATFNGRKAGAMGTIGCFSFFPSKNLGGAGDGGLCTTADAALHEKMVKLRNHGSHPKYYHALIGGNFRLDALQAVVLSVKLKYLDQWHEGRRRNAAFYDAAFAGCATIGRPVVRPGNYMIYNQYVIRVPNRDKVLAALKAAQVGAEIYYPVPLHLQECFRYLGYKDGSMPASERAARETLALPIYPELTDAQKQHVADTVTNAVA